MRPSSEDNPLDLIERDLIVAMMVEPLRTRALVRRHLLCVFQEPAVKQIDGDAGRPERVAAERGDDPGLARMADDHPPPPWHARRRRAVSFGSFSGTIGLNNQIEMRSNFEWISGQFTGTKFTGTVTPQFAGCEYRMELEQAS